jgi:hypothetical protein
MKSIAVVAFWAITFGLALTVSGLDMAEVIEGREGSSIKDHVKTNLPFPENNSSSAW